LPGFFGYRPSEVERHPWLHSVLRPRDRSAR
jgi:hypothetical protein